MPYFRGEVVSDAYLQSLLTAYRQAYVNAGGPDYEDSDQPLLDMFAARGIVDTSGAAGAGRDQAAIDRANKEEARPQSLSPGGAIPVTPPMNPPAVTAPPVVNTVTSGGDAVAFMTLPGVPTMGSSAAPNAAAAGLIAAGASPIGGGGAGGGGLLSSGGIMGIPWLLIIGVGVAAWYLMKGGKK